MNISAKAVTTASDRVWALQGGSIARVKNPQNRPTLDVAWSTDWEVDDPVDISRSEGGYWRVLDSAGIVYEYTPYGQFTGHTTDLPIGASNCSNVGLGWGFLLAIPFGLLWVVLPIATGVFLRSDRFGEIIGTAGFGSLTAAVFFNHWLPWPFSTVFWLPDIVLGTLLLSSSILLLTRFTDDSLLFKLLGFLLLPVAVVAAYYSPWAIGVVVVGGIAYQRFMGRRVPLLRRVFPPKNPE
jgi:hypothetical protein